MAINKAINSNFQDDFGFYDKKPKPTINFNKANNKSAKNEASSSVKFPVLTNMDKKQIQASISASAQARVDKDLNAGEWTNQGANGRK